MSFTDRKLELLIQGKLDAFRTFIDRGTGERTSVLESCVGVSLLIDLVAYRGRSLVSHEC